MRLSVVLMMVVGLFACEEQPAPDPAESPSETGDSGDTGLDDPWIEGRACPDEVDLSWETVGAQIMLDHCAGCHVDPDAAGGDGLTPPKGLDLTSHAEVQANLSLIYTWAADDNRAMPPADTMTEAERWLLGDWLACGAPVEKNRQTRPRSVCCGA